MLTSIGIASRGLLARGVYETLHVASEGLLRTPDVPTEPSGGASAPRRGRYEPKYYKDRELLEALEEFKRKEIIRDDQEFMELLTMILKSGILN